jgi:hypothetical protein
MLQRRRLEEFCWLPEPAPPPRKEVESGWTLAARDEGLSNAVWGLSVVCIVLFNAMVVRTGGVELEVVLLEVGMAEIALMSD